MSNDLKRPLLFDVHRVKFAPIALVNRAESDKQKLRSVQRSERDDSELGKAELPTSALPMIHSPRPAKPLYVANPTKTPSYFRWKPKRQAENTPGASTNHPVLPHPRHGPQASSPRLSAMRVPGSKLTELSRHSVSLHRVGPGLLDVSNVDEPEPMGCNAGTPSPSLPAFIPNSSRPSSVSVQQADLFQYGDIPTTPTDLSIPSTDNVKLKGPTKETPHPQEAVGRPAHSPGQSDLPGFVLEPIHPPNDAPLVVSETKQPPNLLDEVQGESIGGSLNNGQEDIPDTPQVVIEFSGGNTTRHPQEKVIAQHLLRGKFLRKYLHANNLTRKLKETEQALRSAALSGGVPTLKGGVSLFSRSFITKSAASRVLNTGGAQTNTKSIVKDLLGDDATEILSEQLPVLRRLSSIDKAINNTAKRIRRMSGNDEPGIEARAKQHLSPPAKKPERKTAKMLFPLGTINEKQSGNMGSMKEEEDLSDDLMTDLADDSDVTGARVDPSSAHIMRICQHVIAKRAIKAFLREEMSVITIIEVALRDDVHLMPKWLQSSSQLANNGTPASSSFQQQHAHRISTHEGNISFAPSSMAQTTEPEFHQMPIKAMRADILDAVSGYMREGDQNLCLQEIYTIALQAERDKLWKRAILLASVCVVLDREFLHGVLLRARCCRRLGLWTQAIKDLAHAVLLRPDEYKLVLLRSCLYVKMGELENALVDVNRALAFFPKCIDALLLRAEVFHRQDSIGASLQDLTTALLYDPSCWRAYYDRATIRIRAIEGDEYSLNYHWEHMKYEKLLASIIEDYVNAVRKGCQMVEVVETIGDLTVRLMEFTGDNNVLRQVVNNLSHLLQILAHDHRRSFHTPASTLGTGNRSLSIMSATITVTSGAMASPPNVSANAGLDQQRDSELARELLIASIHAQRGRLFVLLQDRENALSDFDQAVVAEYHYPVAHFYRGAFATLTVTKSDDRVALAMNMQHLNRCISLDPTIAGAYTVRGALFLRDLKFNSALQDFKAAVATDPTLYEVWLQIALIYLNHYHDSEECIKACTSALTNDSCLARALYLRAEAFTRQGNIRAALRDYGRLTIAQPDDRWSQLMRGRLLLQMKHARPALNSFIQFMELGTFAHEQRHGGPTTSAADKRAHSLCGRAYKILARFKHAVDQFQKAVTLHPTSENLVLLSESLHSMGDTENSLRVSEKVINADPNSYKGYVRRAQLLVTIGDFHKAMNEYNTAALLAPKEARVFYERGIVQMQLYLRWRVAHQLNFEDKAWRRSATNKPKYRKHRSAFEPCIPAIEVEAILGADQINDERIVLQNMKTNYAGAIADFCRSIRLDSLTSEPYVDRAELYILGEDYEKAFHDYRTAVDKNPRCIRAYVNLGVLKCQFAAFASAITDFDSAIRFDPKLALAYFNRGVCYQKLELFRHADKSYTRAIEISGKGRDVDAHRNRAISRCFTGLAFEDALRDFDEVRQSAPDDDQLHGGLGYVLLQLGRYEDAANSFATYGRLNRDTFADSGNSYFNLASCTNPQSPKTSQLDRKLYQVYLEKALRLYIRAARLHPSNLDLRLNIANCLRRMNEPLKAISQCEFIYTAKPLHHPSLETKSLCFYQMHRLPEAIEWMNAAIRSCVGSSSALQNIFYAFAHSTIHRHALDRKTVGEQRSDTRPAPKNESMAQAMSVQLQELREKRLVSTGEGIGEMVSSPHQPLNLDAQGVVLTGSSKQMLALYMINRGIMYEKLGAWEEAACDYRDAAHFDPLSVQPLICQATLQLLERRYPESLSIFEKALELEPKNGLVHLNMGVVCLCIDDADKALGHFEEAIEALPTCSYAYANKAVALAKKGELKLAESQLKHAIHELPSRKEYYLTRGKIIAQQKRLQDALIDFSTALFLGYDGKL